MLRIYRRHSMDCTPGDRAAQGAKSRKKERDPLTECKCPLWIEGVHDGVTAALAQDGCGRRAHEHDTH